MASEQFCYELKITKDRIAVLIGKKGEVKKELESLTKTKIQVDSKEGDVAIYGDDGLSLYNAREIVKAIGRGFNPELAKLLLKQDYSLEIISIDEYARNRNDSERVKGRLIGREGKARKTMETLTECYISVYGKTVSIIGETSKVITAKTAVERLLLGSRHGNIYKWLEKRHKEFRKRELLGEKIE
jgi:ribosomal RNA assembly protein